MQGRILHVVAEMDSNDLHRDIQKINHMGPVYMNNLIDPNHSNYSTRRPLNLFVLRVNQTTYGLGNFCCWQGTLLWNSLPEEFKTAVNLNTFKKLTKPGVAQHANAISVPISMKRCKESTF